jgi:hypothetical protein
MNSIRNIDLQFSTLKVFPIIQIFFRNLSEIPKMKLVHGTQPLIAIFFFVAGLKFCGSRRVSHVIHVIGGLLYSICGLTQFVSGIYFMLELPIFQLGSNIWTGAWVKFCCAKSKTGLVLIYS